MSRGIISIFWGDEAKLPIDRLRALVKEHHPELPHEIIKLDGEAEDTSNLNQNSRMLDLSPFDETLYLDIDTVVMSRLEFGFEKAVDHGMAICICEVPRARRYNNLFKEDELEYNTGALFFLQRMRKKSPIYGAV